MLDRQTAETLIAAARALSDTILAGLSHNRALGDQDSEPKRAACKFNTNARHLMHDAVDAIEAGAGREVSLAVTNWHRARVVHARHLALGLPTTGERRAIAELEMRVEAALDAQYA